MELSIFEAEVPPRFRLAGPHADAVRVETLRADGARQVFLFDKHGTYWESADEVPEPHEFEVTITVEHDGQVHIFKTRFAEYDDGYGRASANAGWHGQILKTSHPITASVEAKAPLREHRHNTPERIALLVILGSSPMIESIPAFFAAGKYGIGLIIAMSLVLAISTIATYVLLCVFSTAGLQRVRLGALERYGEVLSGALIALIGVVFWIWPVL